jgi:DNA-binding Lrp family transcriptional regulator
MPEETKPEAKAKTGLSAVDKERIKVLRVEARNYTAADIAHTLDIEIKEVEATLKELEKEADS